MASNTKLFYAQKQYVKDYICNNPTVDFYFGENVTVMVKPEFPGSRMFVVSISTMAPDEIKFRKNVGRYFCINNLENGGYILMNYKTLKGFLDSIIYD